jgi:mono/diheme cytochrome c family protein
MRASLRKVGRDRLAPSGRVLPVALLVVLATTAACNGEREKSASSGDTTSSATQAAATDTATTTTATARDTSAAPPTKADTSATAAAGQPPDTSRKRPPSAGPRPAKRVATAAKDTTKAQDTTAKAKADTVAAAPAQAEAPLRDAYHQAPRDTVSEAVYDGWKQFNLNCARCHGEDALGTTIAPHLIVSLRPDGTIPTKELFMSTVCAGRPAKGMPAWCSLGLTMDKIQDIYAYVKGRSDGKIAPGRPAVREGT